MAIQSPQDGDSIRQLLAACDFSQVYVINNGNGLTTVDTVNALNALRVDDRPVTRHCPQNGNIHQNCHFEVVILGKNSRLRIGWGGHWGFITQLCAYGLPGLVDNDSNTLFFRR